MEVHALGTHGEALDVWALIYPHRFAGLNAESATGLCGGACGGAGWARRPGALGDI